MDSTISHSEPLQFVAPFILLEPTTCGGPPPCTDAWSEISLALSGSSSGFDAYTRYSSPAGPGWNLTVIPADGGPPIQTSDVPPGFSGTLNIRHELDRLTSTEK